MRVRGYVEIERVIARERVSNIVVAQVFRNINVFSFAHEKWVEPIHNEMIHSSEIINYS